VAKRRKEVGLTQAKLAAQLDSTAAYVSKIERGERRVPGTVTLMLLAVALEVPLSALMVRGGLVERCRYPEHLDAALTALEGWRSTVRITEAARVLEEMASILHRNQDKVPAELKHLLNPLKTHADTLRGELRVAVESNPRG
jgi:transcriptional regulator with XRE-family HTH domain